MSKSIVWNDKAAQYLSPLQRDAFERGEEIRRLAGAVHRDSGGHVWFRDGEHYKLVGQAAGAKHADASLDAPTDKPGAKAKKPRAKSKK
jgi:hypothetical protein